MPGQAASVRGTVSAAALPYLRVIPASASSSSTRASMKACNSPAIFLPVALQAVLNRVCRVSGRSKLSRLVGPCPAGPPIGFATELLSCPTPPRSNARICSSVGCRGFGAAENVFFDMAFDLFS